MNELNIDLFTKVLAQVLSEENNAKVNIRAVQKDEREVKSWQNVGCFQRE